MKAMQLCSVMVLMAVFSMVNALTLNVRFLQHVPASFAVSYAVSTGDCSLKKSMDCSYSHSSMSGIAGSHAEVLFKNLNILFKTKVPVADKIHKSTNFIEIKIQGQSGVCRASLLGKKVVTLNINKNGTCLKV